MTDQAIRVVPAGWYENPADPTQVRWWNGIAWTDHVQAKPDLEAAALAESAELDEQFADATASLRPRGRVASTSTMSSWLLAFSPILFIAAVAASIYAQLYYVQSPITWLIMLVPYALGVMWGIFDIRKLTRWGHTPPAVFWAFLTPLGYLIARKMTVAGWGQLGTFVGILLAAGAAHLALWTTGAAEPLEFAITIQTEIRDDLVGSGVATAVACPPVADTTTVGAIYTCDATLTDGTHRNVWVSIDSENGDYSYTLAVH
ncbi:DUF2510 domain-containing protein [Protaetiibacter mangrovi]|uniref:DUF2510 domain-containing protein n=1 Tax=Protaetiibacter mangrovi TaxID=2970926 RepID=A0ABT1ZBE8_9MICO|nr:DUF2510 domain-containing protein [Protaetiibacter mangrovi]MCS0498009.1 DUF2510 domain-containing protein [Protaetiibacter mangrovi]